MDTTNLDILNILARTATNLGRAEDAERYFHQVLSADSSNFYANYQLARLYFQLGEYEKAVDAYEKLQAQNEDNTVLYRAIDDSRDYKTRRYRKSLFLPIYNPGY